MRPLRPIRILQVVPLLDPAYGGPTEVAVNVCVAMRRARLDNTLAFAAGGGPVANGEAASAMLVAEGVTVRRFAVFQPSRTRTRRWGVSPGLCGWLARCAGGFDVVHIHGAWGAAQLVGLLAARLRGRPCVMTPHETLTEFDVNKPGHWYRTIAKKALKRFYLRNLSLVVFSSELERRDSLPAGEQVRSVVISHPVRRALEAPSGAVRNSSGSFTVGFLGRLHPKKNLELLIRAVDGLSGGARLAIAGEGPNTYEAELRGLVAALGMDDRVDWVGFLEGDRRWAFLDEVDVLAMPSQYECFGMVAAEAMARGTPAVVSRETGIAELIERHRCGLVIDLDLEQLTQALKRLIDDRPTLTQMAAAGAAGAHQALSLQAYGHKMEGCYRSLERAEGPAR
jgi:glycosyltransferase involved in cell wall biosynthesis